MRQLILTLGLLSVFLISCHRDDLVNTEKNSSNILSKEYIKTANKKEQLFYKKHYLKEALKEVQKLNINLIDLVVASKNSNVEENVILLSEIISAAKNKNFKFKEEDENRFARIENAFKDLDDANYKISFYIPFAEKVEKSSNKAVANDIYIFEQEDNSEQTAFEGVVLNEDGEYVTYEQLITEEMAEEMAEEGRAVIIVGIKNVITDGNNPNNPPSSSSNPYFNIKSMIIKQHKESWIAGQSDITFDGNIIAGGYVGRINGLWNWNNYTQYNFWNVKRKDVRKQTLFHVNKSLGYILSSDAAIPEIKPFIRNDDYSLNYIIYEEDNWPTGNRTVTFNYKGKNVSIDYRSADVPYDYRSIVGHPLISPNYYIDNEGIKYNYGYGSNELR